ncbi:hypothetical protein QDR37_03395 [Amnibacterium sp. CER49]|uniref:hypothetical protein n=1 Tax=Amnibacterium sp. CER49 TaxID=3039161 RepID=UPI0024495A8D|nr:hypothetical protein [Amnibacterium sp. CER49]MDH2442984.1 hypothetical protein [Amnibacterium sp. CER49]
MMSTTEVTQALRHGGLGRARFFPRVRGVADSLLTGGLAFYVLFVLVHTVLAVTTDGVSVQDFVELGLICIPYGVLIIRWRLESWLVGVLAFCLLGSIWVNVWTLPLDRPVGGYQAWPFGAVTFVLLGFTLAGRYSEAWLILLGAAGIAIGWSASSGLGVGPGIELVDRHFATLLVGTLLANSYRRSNRAFLASQESERRARAAEEAAAARAGARRGAAEAVLEQAGPMLQAIADGRPMTAVDRRELLVLEGALRDQIRAPGLLQGRLPEVVGAARRRGVNVLLVDEAALDRRTGEQAADWLARRIERITGDRFVGRVRSTMEGLVLTAVDDAGSETATLPHAVSPARPASAGRNR